jgi:hypothetical protein
MQTACLSQDHRVIFVVMKSLVEVEAAAELLPPEQKEELLRFLAERLRQQRTAPPPAVALSRSKRRFPISKGRRPFTSADVSKIEAEADPSANVVVRR